MEFKKTYKYFGPDNYFGVLIPMGRGSVLMEHGGVVVIITQDRTSILNAFKAAITVKQVDQKITKRGNRTTSPFFNKIWQTKPFVPMVFPKKYMSPLPICFEGEHILWWPLFAP